MPRPRSTRWSAQGVIPEVIAVMPSGGGAGLFGRSLYVDTYDGRSRMEQYVVHDLVAWTDSTFAPAPSGATGR